MALVLSLNEGLSIKLEIIESCDELMVDELDHISLRERLEMLIGSNGVSYYDVLERESKRLKIFPMLNDVAIKDEEAKHPLPVVFLRSIDVCLDGEGKDERFVQEQISADMVYSGSVHMCLQNASTCQYEGLLQDCTTQDAHTLSSVWSSPTFYSDVKTSVIGLENVNATIENSHEYPTLSASPVRVKVEYSDNDIINPYRDCTNASATDVVEACNFQNEIQDEPESDELDYISLKQRHRMLLSRGSRKTVERIHASGVFQGTFLGQSTYLEDGTLSHCAGKTKETSHNSVKECSVGRSNSLNIHEENASKVIGASTLDSTCNNIAETCSIRQCSPTSSSFEERVLPKSLIFREDQENESISSIHSNTAEFEVPSQQECDRTNPDNLQSLLSTHLLNVKVEVLENSSEVPCKRAFGALSDNSMLALNGESGTSIESYEDKMDHMSLRQRKELLISRKDFNYCSRNLNCLRKTVPSPLEYNSSVPKNATAKNLSYRRKRKKTATNSVETALQEDAPGLLQVLIDKGIMVDEIKLYGDMENEDALDLSFVEETFGDLENVISKLFSERTSFLKFAPVRRTKGSRPSYCLACLISLVEQTRYLEFRKWPVEWGWCRDLQSFIFVFERHNRIVLERPEYGYATYFFELVDSLPIKWQIKRLVIAMKVTSCSRAALIENKSLLVGEDLTEGEAGVLEEYGWAPNTGLGSMLNYRDRVVHDRKSEMDDGQEWRSKIGKLLMDGFNAGNIVLNNLPKKALEYDNIQTPQIKSEF